MTSTTPEEKQLSVKELAFELQHHTSYIYAMKGRGFMMPGGRATLHDALAWLARNNPPKSRKWK